MQPMHWMEQALELTAPWRVTRIVRDPVRQRLDVWISCSPEARGWFARPPQSVHRSAPRPERVWRHLDLGSQHCYVHLAAGDTSPTHHLACCGDAGHGLSRAMVRRVVAFLGQGVGLTTLSSVLVLPVEELWKIKQNLEQQPAAPTPAPREKEAAAVTAPAATEVVPPPPEHPVWERVLRGEVALEIKTLPLKLMLSHLREQATALDDPEVLMLRIGELHRYFHRHPHSLTHELAQLNAWSPA